MDFEKPKRWTKLHQILHDNTGLRYFFTALGIILAVGLVLIVLLQTAPGYNLLGGGINTYEKPEPPKYYSPLTGREVKSEKATTSQVTAIMLENSPDARPQSGLKNSGIVFEAIAEGGITRFLALYQEDKPSLVGPVRSLRPYYVDWLAAFDASVAHVGGSHKALKEIRNGKYKDIDQFFNPQAYWRANDRYAPHNVYTNFKLLDALNKSKGYTSSKFTGFVREPVPTKKPTQDASSQSQKTPSSKAATLVNVEISSPTYNSSYRYDSKSKSYARSQGGERHVDREKGRITPRVVIVMKIPTSIGFEDGYREQMQTIGKGTAYVFQNGRVVKGLWQKKSKRSQIKFVDSTGKDIPLARGQTWITAIPTDKSVAWK